MRSDEDGGAPHDAGRKILVRGQPPALQSSAAAAAATSAGPRSTDPRALIIGGKPQQSLHRRFTPPPAQTVAYQLPSSPHVLPAGQVRQASFHVGFEHSHTKHQRQISNTSTDYGAVGYPGGGGPPTFQQPAFYHHPSSQSMSGFGQTAVSWGGGSYPPWGASAVMGSTGGTDGMVHDGVGGTEAAASTGGPIYLPHGGGDGAAGDRPLDKSCFTAFQGGMLSTDTLFPELGREVYYVGIIDILQEYNARKTAETIFKGIVHQRAQLSSVPPREYAARFVSFMSSIIV